MNEHKCKMLDDQIIRDNIRRLILLELDNPDRNALKKLLLLHDRIIYQTPHRGGSDG